MHVQQNAECDASIMRLIDGTMRRVNPYVHRYRQLNEVAKRAEEEADRAEPVQWQLHLIRKATDDPRRYNLPVTNKDCMYLIDSPEGNVPNLDLAVHPRRDKAYEKLKPLSRHIDPMVKRIF